jgi:hypothetical protein
MDAAIPNSTQWDALLNCRGSCRSEKIRIVIRISFRRHPSTAFKGASCTPLSELLAFWGVIQGKKHSKCPKITQFECFYSKVWFNTPRLAAAQMMQRFQEIGIKPDGIINFLSNEPPISKLLYFSDTSPLGLNLTHNFS